MLISQSRYFDARYQAENFLKDHPDNPRIRQLLALSMAKSGATEEALAMFEPVYRQSPEDQESAGILGGIYKTLFKEQESQVYAIKSYEIYLANFLKTKNYYTGINAATMSIIGGKVSQGKEIARTLIDTLEKKESMDFWEYATLAEAFLLVKNKEQATKHYFKTRTLAENDWGKIRSIHNQLWLLNHFISVPKEITKIFTPPNVVAFVGHMIDHPARKDPRFPPQIEDVVKKALLQDIQSHRIDIGYSSIACGADILFIEAMAELGKEINIYIPFSPEDVIETSVRFAGEEWVKRFHKILSEQKKVKLITTDPFNGNDSYFHFLGLNIFGAAIIRAASMGTVPGLFTVLSEFDRKKSKGGTRNMMELWPYQDKVTHVNIDPFRESITISPKDQSLFSEKQKLFPGDPNKMCYVLYVELFSALEDRDNLSDMVSSIENDFISKLTKEFIPPIYSFFSSSKIELIFNTSTEAYDSTILLWKIFIEMLDEESNKQISITYKAAMHAGSIKFQNGRLDTRNSKTLGTTKLIAMKSSTGAIFASEQYSNVLALYRQNIRFEPVGVLQELDPENTIRLYKIKKTSTNGFE